MIKNKQKGAALLTSMIVLLVITMLAVTGMATARLGITMAGNMQFMEQAFQASEAGLERRFLQGAFTNGDVDVFPFPNTVNLNFNVTTTVTFEGKGPVLADGYDLGTEIGANHYKITSNAQPSVASLRGANASTVQGLYKIGPGGG